MELLLSFDYLSHLNWTRGNVFHNTRPTKPRHLSSLCKSEIQIWKGKTNIGLKCRKYHSLNQIIKGACRQLGDDFSQMREFHAMVFIHIQNFIDDSV